MPLLTYSAVPPLTPEVTFPSVILTYAAVSRLLRDKILPSHMSQLYAHPCSYFSPHVHIMLLISL
jgi:hypothetical protein